jgi:hypothetical protein
MTNAIAGEFFRGIAGIATEILIPLRESREERFAGNLQQGANERDSWCEFTMEGNSTQAGEAGPTYQVVEQGFRLIVEMVSSGDPGGLATFGRPLEKFEAGVAGGFFDTGPQGGQRRDIDLLDVTREIEGLGELFDEAGILVAFFPSKRVIQMSDAQCERAFVLKSGEAEEESDAIGSTGDGNDPGSPHTTGLDSRFESFQESVVHRFLGKSVVKSTKSIPTSVY